jgi:dynein heavy chain
MLVGPTCGGKTTTKSILKKMNRLPSQTMDWYRPVHSYTPNPKSLTMDGLDGEQHPQNHESVDRLIVIIFDRNVERAQAEGQWIIFDGPSMHFGSRT